MAATLECFLRALDIDRRRVQEEGGHNDNCRMMTRFLAGDTFA